MNVFENAHQEIDILHGPPLQRISDCLRGFICAPEGKILTCSDFNAIEACVLAWLAGQENILEIFRTHGKIYEYTASLIFGIPISEVTEAQRLIGKVATLALGFQGGVKAFQSMAPTYLVIIKDKLAESIKVQWREKNKEIVSYWYKIESAATSAVLNPGQVFWAGPKHHKDRAVRYKKKGDYLLCRLPSGRTLKYPYPKIQVVDTPWGAPKEAVTFMGVNSQTKKWERQKGYGGFFTENVTQAVARDVLVDAMPRLEKRGYSIVTHSHDEVVSETDRNKGSLKEMNEIMCEVPHWAIGLPISASGWRGVRYRK